MDFKQIKIDGVDILQEGILYSQVNWRKLSTTDQSRNVEGLHSRVVSPTYARYRVITLEGVIDRLTPGEENRIQHLQSLFSLQTELYRLEEKKLYIKDSFDNEWELNVKVKDPFDFIEGDDRLIGSHWSWRVVLESTGTPVYQSSEELMVSGNEGNYGGFKMGFNLGVSFDSVDEVIEINTLQTTTYTRFEVSCVGQVNSPITIRNITNDTFFSLDVDGVEGDKIIIDSDSFSVTKNGVNILDKRLPGSTWQKVNGNNKYILYDKDGNLQGKDVEVKVYFSNAML